MGFILQVRFYSPCLNIHVDNTINMETNDKADSDLPFLFPLSEVGCGRHAPGDANKDHGATSSNNLLHFMESLLSRLLTTLSPLKVLIIC